LTLQSDRHAGTRARMPPAKPKTFGKAMPRDSPAAAGARIPNGDDQ